VSTYQSDAGAGAAECAGRFTVDFCWRTRPSIRSTPHFDLLALRRFGVIFLPSPALSFANMRQALRPSGRLAFACWRDLSDNPFSWRRFHQARLQAHVPNCRTARDRRSRAVRVLPPRRASNRQSWRSRFTRDGQWSRQSALDGRESAAASMLRAGRAGIVPAARALEVHPEDVRAAATKSIREALTAFANARSCRFLPLRSWIDCGVFLNAYALQEQADEAVHVCFRADRWIASRILSSGRAFVRPVGSQNCGWCYARSSPIIARWPRCCARGLSSCPAQLTHSRRSGTRWLAGKNVVGRAGPERQPRPRRCRRRIELRTASQSGSGDRLDG